MAQQQQRPCSFLKPSIRNQLYKSRTIEKKANEPRSQAELSVSSKLNDSQNTTKSFLCKSPKSPIDYLKSPEVKCLKSVDLVSLGIDDKFL